jgi:hypothetical protein
MDLSKFQTHTAAGEAVLSQALAQAHHAFGDRLVAAYALGSLAHGGFSEHVSDVDFGVVLRAPLLSDDASSIEAIAAAIKAAGAPLSDRLSIFWGSPDTLSARTSGGRFPPVDVLDLREHGRLLAGRDVRLEVRLPSTAEMIVAAATQALKMMAGEDSNAKLFDPAPLVASGARTLTKRILFPVRFVYTARTGRIGRNDAAVEHFIQTERGAVAELVLSAFHWRYAPFEPGDPAVLEQARRGLLPLYRLFVDDYEPRLRSLGEGGLAAAFAAWREALSFPLTAPTRST